MSEYVEVVHSEQKSGRENYNENEVNTDKDGNFKGQDTKVVPTEAGPTIQHLRRLPPFNLRDDLDPCPLPKRRKKTTYSEDQVTFLEQVFLVNNYPCKKKLESIGWKLDLAEEKVRNWFQNRRARAKRQIRKIQERDQHLQKFYDVANSNLESTENKRPIVSNVHTAVTNFYGNQTAFYTSTISTQPDVKPVTSYVSNLSQETYSPLFYHPRLSVPSHTGKQTTPVPATPSPYKKPINPRAYVRPFNVATDRFAYPCLPVKSVHGHINDNTIQQLSHVNTGITGVSSPAPFRREQAMPVNSLPRATIAMTTSSYPNLGTYHYGLYRPAFQTPVNHQGLGLGGQDLYQNLIHYHDASGGVLNFLTPLPVVNQMYQRGQIQHSVPTLNVAPLNNVSNLNDSSQFLNWNHFLLSYQQQLLLQNALNNQRAVMENANEQGVRSIENSSLRKPEENIGDTKTAAFYVNPLCVKTYSGPVEDDIPVTVSSNYSKQFVQPSTRKDNTVHVNLTPSVNNETESGTSQVLERNDKIPTRDECMEGNTNTYSPAVKKLMQGILLMKEQEMSMPRVPQSCDTVITVTEQPHDATNSCYFRPITSPLFTSKSSQSSVNLIDKNNNVMNSSCQVQGLMTSSPDVTKRLLTSSPGQTREVMMSTPDRTKGSMISTPGQTKGVMTGSTSPGQAKGVMTSSPVLQDDHPSEYMRLLMKHAEQRRLEEQNSKRAQMFRGDDRQHFIQEDCFVSVGGSKSTSPIYGQYDSLNRSKRRLFQEVDNSVVVNKNDQLKAIDFSKNKRTLYQSHSNGNEVLDEQTQTSDHSHYTNDSIHKDVVFTTSNSEPLPVTSSISDNSNMELQVNHSQKVPPISTFTSTLNYRKEKNALLSMYNHNKPVISAENTQLRAPPSESNSYYNMYGQSLFTGNDSGFWQKADDLDESVSDEDSSNSTETYSASVSNKDNEETDSAYSPQLNVSQAGSDNLLVNYSRQSYECMPSLQTEHYREGRGNQHESRMQYGYQETNAYMSPYYQLSKFLTNNNYSCSVSNYGPFVSDSNYTKSVSTCYKKEHLNELLANNLSSNVCQPLDGSVHRSDQGEESQTQHLPNKYTSEHQINTSFHPNHSPAHTERKFVQEDSSIPSLEHPDVKNEDLTLHEQSHRKQRHSSSHFVHSPTKPFPACQFDVACHQTMQDLNKSSSSCTKIIARSYMHYASDQQLHGLKSSGSSEMCFPDYQLHVTTKETQVDEDDSENVINVGFQQNDDWKPKADDTVHNDDNDERATSGNHENSRGTSSGRTVNSIDNSARDDDNEVNSNDNSTRDGDNEVNSINNSTRDDDKKVNSIDNSARDDDNEDERDSDNTTNVLMEGSHERSTVWNSKQDTNGVAMDSSNNDKETTCETTI